MRMDKNKRSRKGRNGRKSRSRVGAAHAAKGSRVISATDAARSFSELLDRVCYRGETFVIERGGEPVCQMSHVKSAHFTGADLIALLDSLPHPDAAYWEAVEDATRQKPMVPESPWEH